MQCSNIALAILLTILIPVSSVATPLLAPGDMGLRHDLQLLNDAGVIDIPMTAWPLSVSDIEDGLSKVDLSSLTPTLTMVANRISDRIRPEMEIGVVNVAADVAVAVEPRFVRSFENTPRDEGEFGARISWTGERFTVRLAATGVADPFDDDEFRPDGSYIGVALGNWMLTAGWQDRWWGPSRDGSLILSTNARPAPGIMLQRSNSDAFKTRWLSWIGPWTLTTFISELDDERTIANTRLFGVRGSFRPPHTGLEIGISRTAQWCGDGRPCSLSTFGDLLVGNDNRGVNVDFEDEPGNQLGGFDIRWTLPRGMPAALYMQWIGEDGRGGGGAIGSWLRQLGAEHWGEIGSLQHRSHIEVSDTTCRQGGFGFSDKVPGCAYGHSIYRTGYRYQSRSIAYPADGDSLSYSIGSTLVQSGGHTWNVLIRHMEINREGSTRPGHTLSATPSDISDLQVTHMRRAKFGTISFGLGVSLENNSRIGSDSTDVGGFLQWSSD